MKKLPSLSMVLLAYNEEKVIAENININLEIAHKFADQCEVVVVCFEGSRDQTNQIVARMSRENPEIRQIIQSKSERGYGRAYGLGILGARYDWIFQSDADGQYLYSDFSKLAELVNEGLGLVHGYRRRRMDPIERTIMAFCYNTALKLLYFIPIRDVDSAFKLIKRSAIKNINLVSTSGFCVAESVIKIKKQGYKIMQTDITHLPRTEGEALSDKGIKNPFNLQIPNFSLIWHTLSEMFMFRFLGDSSQKKLAEWSNK